MPVFDIDEKKWVWFDFPGGGRVQLRLPTPSDIFRLDKETIKINPVVHKDDDGIQVLNQRVQDLDKYSQLYNDCSIGQWEEFLDCKGNPILPTAENKTIMMRLNDPTFRDFVNEKLKELDAANLAQVEAEKKT